MSVRVVIPGSPPQTVVVPGRRVSATPAVLSHFPLVLCLTFGAVFVFPFAIPVIWAWYLLGILMSVGKHALELECPYCTFVTRVAAHGQACSHCRKRILTYSFIKDS